MKLGFYRDARGKWRWRVKSRNGEIVGASTQGFSNRSLCAQNAVLVCIALTESQMARMREARSRM